MDNKQIVVSKGSALTPQQEAIMTFTKKIDSNYVQTQLKNVLGKNAGTFATSIVEVFTNDTQLQQCPVNKVVQEAIKAATLKLPLNKQLGYAYLITFKNYNKQTRQVEPTPTLVIGYRGYIQLAMRTGQYRNINADVVYEGELNKADKLTGRIDLSGEKTSDKVEGFFAHFETINGFTKTLYMSLAEMASYALKYSPSFKTKDAPTVNQLCDIAQDQAVNGPTQGVVGWKGDFISMAQKTVLRRLLSKYGYLSIEMMSALANDEETQVQDAEVVRDEAVMEEKPVFSAKAIIEEAQEAEAEEVPEMPI